MLSLQVVQLNGDNCCKFSQAIFQSFFSLSLSLQIKFSLLPTFTHGAWDIIIGGVYRNLICVNACFGKKKLFHETNLRGGRMSLLTN